MRALLTAILASTASLVWAGPIWVLNVEGEANGEIKINLRDDLAPQHVERIVTLTNEGAYDGVVFHRVIDGFMAQSGDVEFGKSGADISNAGRGGSEYEDLPAEFSDVQFDKGVVGMARSQSPDSANSQFFIMLAPGYFLNGDYTVIGEVVEGQDVVDAIKRGNPNDNGSIEGEPDVIVTATIEDKADETMDDEADAKAE